MPTHVHHTIAVLTLSLPHSYSPPLSLVLGLCVLASVIVIATIAIMKHHDQKQVGEERFYLSYVSTL